jgi:tubulin beta
MEPSFLDGVKGSTGGALYRPDNFVVGKEGAANNWAKGHLTEGAALLEPSMEVIRKEVEAADNLQGFQFIHSLGGGTGSGLATKIMQLIRDEFPDRMIAPFTIYPSPKVSDVVVEPYNATFSMHTLLEYADEVFCLDNEALYDICSNILKLDSPGLPDLNHVTSAAVSGLTASMRFRGQLNNDLRKVATNLVPFPRLHFFSIGFAPLTSRTTESFRSAQIGLLARQAFDINNMMCASDAEGRYLAASTIFRGGMSNKEVDDAIANCQDKKSSNFVEWIPKNVQTSICDTAPVGMTEAVTFVGNNTGVQKMFRRISDQFTTMFKKRAFIHWYTDHGVEEEEFNEAVANMTDLEDEYQQYQDGTPADYEGDEE